MRSIGWLAAFALVVAGCALLPLFEDPQGGSGSSTGGTGGTVSTVTAGGSGAGGNAGGFDGWVASATAEPETRVLFYDLDEDEDSDQIVVVGAVFPDPSRSNQELSLGGACAEPLPDDQSHVFVAFYDLQGTCTALHITDVAPPSDDEPVRVAHAGEQNVAFFTSVSLHRISAGETTEVVMCNGQTDCQVRDVVRDDATVYAVGWQKRGTNDACNGAFNGGFSGKEELVLAFVSPARCTQVDLEHGPKTAGEQIAERVGRRALLSGRNVSGLLEASGGGAVCTGACSYFEFAEEKAQPVKLSRAQPLCRAAHITNAGGMLAFIESCDETGLIMFDGNTAAPVPSGRPFSSARANDVAATDSFLYGVGEMDVSDDESVVNHGFLLQQPRPITTTGPIYLFEPHQGSETSRSAVRGVIASSASVLVVGNYLSPAAEGEVALQLRELGEESPTMMVDDPPLEPCVSPHMCRPFLMRWTPPAP